MANLWGYGRNGSPVRLPHSMFPHPCPAFAVGKRNVPRKAGNAPTRFPRSVRHDQDLTIPCKIVNPATSTSRD
nr:hypothetical protein RVX_0788 [Nitratidesulfovibrio sp. HK-II]